MIATADTVEQLRTLVHERAVRRDYGERILQQVQSGEIDDDEAQLLITSLQTIRHRWPE